MNNKLEKLIDSVNYLKETHEFKIIESIKEKIKYLLQIEYIRDTIDWEIPKIVDLSSELDLPNVGKEKIFAIDFSYENKSSHLKTPIFGGLLLLQILQGRLNKNSNLLVEAGGLNTGFALKHLSEKFDIESKFFTSRYLPEKILDYIKADRLSIIKSEKDNRLGIEEEFYIFFIKEFLKLKKIKNVVPLWHIKNSFLVGEILAEEIFNDNKELIKKVDMTVTGVGSGTSLCMLNELKLLSENNFDIIVSEHEKTPILRTNKNEIKPEKNIISGNFNKHFSDFTESGNGRVPHSVYGPHYEKINNKIPNRIISNINGVSIYSDEEWKEISLLMESKKNMIGNSSSANLAVSKKLSIDGKNILTFIYEGKRDYIKK
jgi:cysteine synthase